MMDVSVLGAEGAVVEAGCIMSIRAGVARRQGAVQIDKPLHFPVGVKDAKPFKVDLLQHVGSSEEINLCEDGVYTFPVQQVAMKTINDNACVKLKIAAKAHLCGRTRGTIKGLSKTALDLSKPASSLEPTTVAGQARQYFDDHNVMPVVQSLLEALIRDKPDEPFHYIGIFMDRLSHMKSAPEQAGDISCKFEFLDKVGDVTEGPGMSQAGMKASPSPETEEATKTTGAIKAEEVAKPAPPPQVNSGDNVRFRAINTLTEACNNGCLEKALQRVRECRRDKEVEEASEKCRLRTRSVLVAAATDGRLETSLMKRKEVVTTAPVVSQPLCTAERTRKDLKETAESSDVEKVLKCVHAQVSEIMVSSPPVSHNELVYLSELARDCLARGAADGTLGRTLQKVCPVKKIGLEQPVFQPREKVVEDAVEVTAEASVEATTASVEDTADLRAKIFDSLVSACKTGRLADLLKDVRHCSTEGRAQTLLTTSLETQKLSETLMATEAGTHLPSLQQTSKLDVTARSVRHAELLERQRMLGETNKKYEERLSRLKEGSKPTASPAPPTRPRPNRPRRSIKNSPAFRELCEVNTSLCNENARLNAEFARLLMRVGQQRSDTRA